MRLTIALKDSNPYLHNSAAKALNKMGDAQTLPLIVLCSTLLTVAEKLEALEALRHVHYKYAIYQHEQITLSYPLPSIWNYCLRLLMRSDCETGIKENAEAVLSEIKNRSDTKMLLRATIEKASLNGTTLLRGVSSILLTPPSEHLRPSEPPIEKKGESSFIFRWFRWK